MNAQPPALLFEHREARLSALNDLSRRHWLHGLVHSQGRLEARLTALVERRRHLSAGRLPPAGGDPWPAPAVAAALDAALAELDLPRYCAGHQALTDTVVMSLLFHLDFIVDYQDRGASAGQAAAMAVEAFSDDWRERCGQLDELIEVFGTLPDDGENMNWDQLRGLLRTSGWREVVRIRRLLEHLPELARLIRALGRARPTDEDDANRPRRADTLAATLAQRPHDRPLRIPDMPGETRGVHRSERFARMLPAEAVLLGHPRLRLVWHARRAERALLCYEDDDLLRETRPRREPALRPVPDRLAGQRAETGPMLICVDTSGSMAGGAEAVAKAVVLEALRTAHAQRRACHVFAFGGPGEVVDLELALDTEGIGRLSAFLGQAFRGGTDICGPLDGALAKLESQSWQHADLLVASDGEFGATPELATRLAEAKRRLGLRVQGVLVGDRETLGFLQIADDIFPVRDWRRYGQGADQAGHRAGEPPIHSHRLTALYFPGALRNQANLEATASPAAAAAAVRAGHGPP